MKLLYENIKELDRVLSTMYLPLYTTQDSPCYYYSKPTLKTMC